MLVTRRQLLQSSAVLAPAAAFLPGFLLRQLADPPPAASASTSNRILVIVQQAGGNDGLNTIVPYGEGRYYDLRPNIAIPQQDVIPLDKEVGFHPSLAKFKTLWDSGKLAVVEGVGYPNPNFSHFQSMDIWHYADPAVKIRQGWLGRYLATLGEADNTFSGVAIGRRLPPELYSPRASVAVVESVPLYQFQGDPRFPAAKPARIETLVKMYGSGVDASYRGHLNKTFQSAYLSSSSVVEADKAFKSAPLYPDSPLTPGLRILASAIVGGLGIRVGHVVIGGWDTHASQKPDHARLLRNLSDAIYAFYEDLKAHGKDDNVVIMTWSEFGRRAKSNASDGTDHGSAAPLFIIGKSVKG
ncbi:MAG: DUF1501 domain-containing protein, partial [Chloroflexi bacterium]|nr:DUF1501 domain-containing protein [Chloroflexota bacterium]